MNSVTLKTLGDWKAGIEIPLSDVLRASIDIVGRSGAEACKHAIILMAQSSKNITPKAPAKRPVAADINTRAEFITVYKKDGTESRVFKFMFGDTKAKSFSWSGRAWLEGTWEQAQKIANRGLAQRSWMWGLRGLGVPNTGREIPGVANTLTVLGEKSCGFILRNALKYILKIMPAGWVATVAQRAGNRIMAQARDKLERQWKAEMRGATRRGTAIGSGLVKAFTRAT